MSGIDEQYYRWPLCPRCNKLPRYYTYSANHGPLVWLYQGGEGEHPYLTFSYLRKWTSIEQLDSATHIYCDNCKRTLTHDAYPTVFLAVKALVYCAYKMGWFAE